MQGFLILIAVYTIVTDFDESFAKINFKKLLNCMLKCLCFMKLKWFHKVQLMCSSERKTVHISWDKLKGNPKRKQWIR